MKRGGARDEKEDEKWGKARNPALRTCPNDSLRRHDDGSPAHHYSRNVVADLESLSMETGETGEHGADKSLCVDG